jgi:hypothetical protein
LKKEEREGTAPSVLTGKYQASVLLFSLSLPFLPFPFIALEKLATALI